MHRACNCAKSRVQSVSHQELKRLHRNIKTKHTKKNLRVWIRDRHFEFHRNASTILFSIVLDWPWYHLQLHINSKLDKFFTTFLFNWILWTELVRKTIESGSDLNEKWINKLWRYTSCIPTTGCLITKSIWLPWQLLIYKFFWTSACNLINYLIKNAKMMFFLYFTRTKLFIIQFNLIYLNRS